MNRQDKPGGIAWTDFTVSPIRYRDATGRDVWACVKTSPACEHCYAEAIAQRFDRGGPYTAAATREVTPYLHPGEAHKMLTSRLITGKRVFVEDMSDLFGEWNSNELIAAAFGIFAERPDVTWQVLTKRSRRMREWFAWVAEAPHQRLGIRELGSEYAGPWPLRNVHLGVTVEDQPNADERIPDLLACPAAVRWVSVEPMLGAIDLADAAGVTYWDDPSAGIRWVVVGGESGPSARPMSDDWMRALRDQCANAGVPFFAKQRVVRGKPIPFADWPADLQVRQWPEVTR